MGARIWERTCPEACFYRRKLCRYQASSGSRRNNRFSRLLCAALRIVHPYEEDFFISAEKFEEHAVTRGQQAFYPAPVPVLGPKGIPEQIFRVGGILTRFFHPSHSADIKLYVRMIAQILIFPAQPFDVPFELLQAAVKVAGNICGHISASPRTGKVRRQTFSFQPTARRLFSMPCAGHLPARLPAVRQRLSHRSRRQCSKVLRLGTAQG